MDGTTATKNSIVYTQINQQLSYNKFITIDADHNGKNDFYFTSVLIGQDNQSHLFLMASPVSASGAKLLLDVSQELVVGFWGKPVDADMQIGAAEPANTSWSNYLTKGMMLDVIENSQQGDLYDGPWVAKADKYLAMQIIISGKVHYGWIHFTHNVNEKRMMILGFAYNDVAGAAIKAGQTQ
ncbi:hypothetical protein A0256_09585 [Mucilaginibacter sp. PAMC 26640]|nr:hypothetical protein A0256_09585 [Mucilaginibacter sp. PAMC 26640]